jgi:hypothetical protein
VLNIVRERIKRLAEFGSLWVACEAPEYVILDDFLAFYPGYTRANTLGIPVETQVSASSCCGGPKSDNRRSGMIVL